MSATSNHSFDLVNNHINKNNDGDDDNSMPSNASISSANDDEVEMLSITSMDNVIVCGKNEQYFDLIHLDDGQINVLDEEMENILGCDNAETHEQNETNRDIIHDTIDQEETMSPIEERIFDLTIDKFDMLKEKADEYLKQAFGISEGGNIDVIADMNDHEDGNLEATVELITRIFGDAFHVMDRIKVPIRHAAKPSYFMALRDAIFLLNPEDVRNVKKAYTISDKEWCRMMSFNFNFIANRVRRRIPPPDILYPRVKAVYDYFQDVIDPTSNLPLFNVNARKKAINVLEMIKAGLLSDPPGVSFYVKVLNHDGSPKTDKKGLQLYRSIRGTNLVESIHQTYTRAFGHSRAGIMYSDNLLTYIRHIHNWRCSLRNRPGFPRLRHFDGEAIDTVNDLYEYVFGVVKYPDWVTTREVINPHTIKSPFGVVSNTSNDCNTQQQRPKKFKNSKEYIAYRQHSDIPYLPVSGKHEYELYNELLKNCLHDGKALSSDSTFQEMRRKWNAVAKGDLNGIYYKTKTHLAKYYKTWRQNQMHRMIYHRVDLQNLMSVLQHVPQVSGNNTNDDTLHSLSLSGQPGINNQAQESGNESTSPTTFTTNATSLNLHKKRRRKECKLCKNPECNGGYKQSSCPKYDQISVKRTYTKKTRTCKLCNLKGCPGHSDHNKCQGR